eukprot:5175926-Prymnesium_polylepis.1
MSTDELAQRTEVRSQSCGVGEARVLLRRAAEPLTERTWPSPTRRPESARPCWDRAKWGPCSANWKRSWSAGSPRSAGFSIA